MNGANSLGNFGGEGGVGGGEDRGGVFNKTSVVQSL